MEKELAVANNKAEEVLVTVTERARESESVKKSVMQPSECWYCFAGQQRVCSRMRSLGKELTPRDM